MQQHSLLEAILANLAEAERDWVLNTGRGKAPKDKYEERVGIAKGLARAIDIVNETAQAIDKED